LQHITLAHFEGIGACDYLKVGLFDTENKKYKAK
jgi:predicted DNA-binding protein with PD1-like motif